jgi:hypothetical protein
MIGTWQSDDSNARPANKQLLNFAFAAPLEPNLRSLRHALLTGEHLVTNIGPRLHEARKGRFRCGTQQPAAGLQEENHAD